jgi:hypothetical protein
MFDTNVGGSSLLLAQKKSSLNHPNSGVNKNDISVGTDCDDFDKNPCNLVNSTPSTSTVAGTPFFIPFLSSPLQGYNNSAISSSLQSFPATPFFNSLQKKQSLPLSSLTKSSTEMIKEDDNKEAKIENTAHSTSNPTPPMLLNNTSSQEYTDVHLKAVVVIQSVWRMHLTASAFRYIRSCAITIQRAWRTHRRSDALIVAAVQEKLQIMLDDEVLTADLRKNKTRKGNQFGLVEKFDASIPSNPINTLICNTSLLSKFKAVVALSMLLYYI